MSRPRVTNDSSLYPGWVTNARMVTHSRGNQPGFPNQFQYLDYETNRRPQQMKMDWNTSYVNENVDIPQVHQDKQIIGEYQAMVPDLPFNESYDKDIRNRLVYLGFAGLVLGAFFL